MTGDERGECWKCGYGGTGRHGCDETRGEAEACDCAPDCAERIACQEVGAVGHFGCGWCDKHNQARHICMCAPVAEPADVTVTDVFVARLADAEAAADVEGESLLDRLTFALVDGNCDLADREPSQQVWDDARSDCELLLPVIAAHVAQQRADAERDRARDAEARRVVERMRALAADWEAEVMNYESQVGNMPVGSPPRNRLNAFIVTLRVNAADLRAALTGIEEGSP